MLSDPSTSPKCYWTLLKTLINDRKIPSILPLFTITNLSLTSKKRVKYLTPSMQNSAHY